MARRSPQTSSLVAGLCALSLLAIAIMLGGASVLGWQLWSVLRAWSTERAPT